MWLLLNKDWLAHVAFGSVAPDFHNFAVDSEDHSQDMPVLQESKASSHSRTCEVGYRSSKDRYNASMKHSATRIHETCSNLLREAQQGHVYDMPTPVSSDTVLQLYLSCFESLDKILILEGVDITRCAWDETTNAGLDMQVEAFKYSDCVQNKIFWRIGHFICKTTSKRMLRDEKVAHLAKRFKGEKMEEYQHSLASSGCSVDLGQPIKGLHCCCINSGARNLNDCLTNTSKYPFVLWRLS